MQTETVTEIQCPRCRDRIWSQYTHYFHDGSISGVAEPTGARNEKSTNRKRGK